MNNPIYGFERIAQIGRMVEEDELGHITLLAYETYKRDCSEENIDAPIHIIEENLGLSLGQILCIAWSVYSGVVGREKFLYLWNDDSNNGGYPESLFLSTAKGYELKKVVREFVVGQSIMVPNGVEFFVESGPLLHNTVLRDEIVETVENYIENPPYHSLLIRILGEEGSGQKEIIASVAAILGFPLLVVDEKTFSLEDFDSVDTLSKIAGLAIVVVAAEKSSLVELFIKNSWMLFTIENEGSEVSVKDLLVVSRRVKQISKAQRMDMLEELLRPLGLHLAREELVQRISRFTFNQGQFDEFAARLGGEFLVNPEIELSQLEEIFMDVLTKGNFFGARQLSKSHKFDDLVLPPEHKKRLKELCDSLYYREKVFEEWNFKSRAVYGKGVSILLYGAPGTGKTMTARVIADYLGMEIFCVDISTMISKYIGETQKNLGKVFDEAAKRQCVLFFDEADALFSKRTEATDSFEKHSNAEVAYLLQRMEQQEGVCILATNLFSNFDEAFKRRISYVFHLPLPDEEQREEIWRWIFPKEVPLATIDFNLLAQKLELSGAEIRNCALNSCCAAAREASPVTMKHIVEAVRAEYVKQGKMISNNLQQMIQ